MHTKIRKLIVLLGFVVLAGCGTTYTFNNENFRSSAEGLAAQKLYFDNLISEIKVRDKKIQAKILVITPNRVTIEAVGMNRTGTPKQEIVDYVTETSENSYKFFFHALVKSQLFTQVESKLSEHPLKDARKDISNYSAVVYLHIISPTQMGWYLLKTGDEKPIPIVMDQLTKGSQRVESWIDSVESGFGKK
jgi:hypothetical protein